MDGLGARLGRHRRAEEDVDAVASAALRAPLRVELAAEVREDRAVRAADVHRDDGRRRAARDVLQPAPERLERAGARDGALGEDAHEPAIAQGGLARAQEARLADARGRVVDEDDAEDAEYRREPVPAAVQDAGHDEADAAVARGREQERVGVGGVVGDEERAAAHGEVVDAVDADVVERAQSPARDHARGEGTEDKERLDEERDREEPEREAVHAVRKRRAQERSDERSDESRDGEDAPHLRLPFQRHLAEERDVERHHEEPAAEAEEAERHERRRREAQRERRRHRHEERPKRHQPELHVAPRAPERDSPAEKRARGERREDPQPARPRLAHQRPAEERPGREKEDEHADGPHGEGDGAMLAQPGAGAHGDLCL